MLRGLTTRLVHRKRGWLLCLQLLLLLLLPTMVRAGGDLTAAVIGSKHNLSAGGPGPVTSSRQDACIFCHTPHSSDVNVKPLWNHTLPTQTYNTYTSSTYNAGAGSPAAGSSKQCLSCHDGTVALGATVSEGLISTTGSMGAAAALGTELTNDHPIAVQPVDDGQLNLNLFQSPPSTGDPSVMLVQSKIECSTCHSPHEPTRDAVAGKFLVRSNANGALCLACHDTSRPLPNTFSGWPLSAHAVSANTVPTTGTFPPYGTVSTNACTNCHASHSVPSSSAARLLRNAEETACSPCHNGANVTPAIPNVLADFSKAYAHPTNTLSAQHDPTEDAFPLSANRHAECADCHEPHSAKIGSVAGTPPGVEPALTGVSGYNGGSPLRPASNEYEVCFKCHADSTNKPQNSAGYSTYGRTAIRQGEQVAADPHNLRQKFGTALSRHNVTQPRRLTSAEVPSLRAFILNPDGSQGRSLAVGTYIYCTDCHASDQAARSGGTGADGPHGSIYAHVLTQRFEQEVPPANPGDNAPGVPYSSGPNGPFALCNKCHDIDNSLLQDIGPFTKHNRHIIGEPSSCSTCHDPHGIHDLAGNSNVSNPHLVSFDLQVIGPNRNGELRIDSTAKECYLTCHGTGHNPKRY